MTSRWMSFALIPAAALAMTPSLAGADDDDGGGLPGSYNVEVCVRLSDGPVAECDGTSPGFLGFFRSLVSFGRDGTLTESDNFPGALDGSFSFSDGHGSWRKARGRNAFEGIFIKVHRPLPPAIDNNFERVLLRFSGDGAGISGRFVVPESPTFPGIAGTFVGPRVTVETF